MPVDRPGQFAADISVVERPETRRQDTGVRELVDPALPVIAPHHRYRGGRFILTRRRNGRLEDLAGFGVEGLDVDRSAERLDRRAIGLAGVRVCPDRSGHAVDQHVQLSELFAHPIDEGFLQVVGEGVALEREGRPSDPLGLELKCAVVVPAGAARLACRRLALQ